jgi:hypothetical protein
MGQVRTRMTRYLLARRLPRPLRHPLLRPLTHNRAVDRIVVSRLRRRARTDATPTVH